MTDYLLRQPVLYKKTRFGASIARRVKNFYGTGYLAGDYPVGITKVDGVPSAVEIRVLWRGRGDDDGCLVAKTMSDHTGVWRVSNLNPNLKYDVVARVSGFNDMIMSNVNPANE
ncbi:MAG: hypothetical protein RSB25_17535 [Acinetobacter sp.]